MLVLIVSLFVATAGLVAVAFRKRLQASLPFVENQRLRDLHSGAPRTITYVSLFLVVVGAAGLTIYMTWFR